MLILKQQITRTNAALTCCALFIMYMLKRHYSLAAPESLQWVLGPTTFLVEGMTGFVFGWEQDAGFASRAAGMVIAKPCAGVNFMIVSFLTLFLAGVIPQAPAAKKVRSFLLCFLISYLATVLVNAARISLAIWLNKNSDGLFGLSAESVHLVEGIVVYFGSLWLLYGIAQKGVKGHVC